MERDTRRGRDQWRGCFSFKDIVCEDDDGTQPNKRSGGLKMGHTYYYYYEVDGSIETYDPTMPSTTTCPYMPGQAVNTLNVPLERSLRFRSASLNSMRVENFKTMNPAAKFTNPKPVTPPSDRAIRRTESADVLRHCASSSSLLPAPSWKRLFSRKIQNVEAERSRSLDRDDRSELYFTSYDTVISFPTTDARQSRTSTFTESSRTRDISPDSLRRMLSEDSPPTRSNTNDSKPPALVIPDNGADYCDEDDDDENFATSAISESVPYTTSLSPPPFQRSSSSDSIALAESVSWNGALTLRTAKSTSHLRPQLQANSETGTKHHFAAVGSLGSSLTPRWSASTGTNHLSPTFDGEEPMSTVDEEDEDEDEEDDTFPYLPLLPTSTFQQHAFDGYSLPSNTDGAKIKMSSPKLMHSDTGVPVNGSNLLGTHVDSGLDDFVSELGWIVDAIGTNN